MNGIASNPLHPALAGELDWLDTPAGRLAYYRSRPQYDQDKPKPPPLLLIHSVNAAATAYDMKPIYDRYAGRRAVYVPDLPGFGCSDRSNRSYTPRLMTDAVHAVMQEIARREGETPVDAMALSLGSEFLARAASETPERFRSLALISPTGFRGGRRLDGTPGSTRGMPWLFAAFTRPPWSQAVYNTLTRRGVIRHFLNKAWGSKNIDEGMLDYSVATTRQPGAMHAPYHFLSGFLFSNDITTVYRSLPMPVLMTHGDRGDFVDYRGKMFVEGQSNWRIRTFEAGALPYYEIPDVFFKCYEQFISDTTTPA